MSLVHESILAKGAWIDAFVDRVLVASPQASARRLAAAAEDLHARFGDMDPVEVAEAAWDVLPLGSQRVFGD